MKQQCNHFFNPQKSAAPICECGAPAHYRGCRGPPDAAADMLNDSHFGVYTVTAHALCRSAIFGKCSSANMQNGLVGSDTDTRMPALPPKADMCGATRDVCFGPIADIRERARPLSHQKSGAMLGRSQREISFWLGASLHSPRALCAGAGVRFTPKADMCSANLHVCFGPKADIERLTKKDPRGGGAAPVMQIWD